MQKDSVITDMKKFLLLLIIILLPSVVHGFGSQVKIYDVTNEHLAFSPSIARNSDGDIFVAYFVTSGDGEGIRLDKSTDDGGTFVRVHTYNVPAGDGIRHPIIKIDASNRIHLLYSYNKWAELDYNLFYSVSDNEGLTFSTPVQISSASLSSLSVPDIAVSNNDIYIVWHSDNRRICFNKSVGGTPFSSSETVLTDNFSNCPSIETGDDGSIFLAWQAMDDQAQYHIYFSKSINKGISFSAPQHIDQNSSVYDDTRPQIATYKNIVYVSWKYVYLDRQCRIAKSVDNGLTFSRSIILNTAGDMENSSPIISVDNMGFVHAAWTDYRNSGATPDIYYAISTDSATSFSANIKINNLSGKPTYGQKSPSMCLGDNYIYIAWYGVTPTDSWWSIYFSKGKSPVVTSDVAGNPVSSASIDWSWIDKNKGLCQELGYRIKNAATGIVLASLPPDTTFWLQTNTSPNYLSSIFLETFNNSASSTSTASCYTLAIPPSNPGIENQSLHSLTLSYEGNAGTCYRIDRSQDGIQWVTLVDSAAAYTMTTFKNDNLMFATTYYYAIYGYNGNNVITLSSCTVSGSTASLPDNTEFMLANSAIEHEQKAVDPEQGTVTVTVPGQSLTNDGYIMINVDADSNPKEISKENLDCACNKLTALNRKIITNSIVEINMYDVAGSTISDPLTGNAILSLPYTDSNDDGYVDNAGSTPLKVNALSLCSLNKATLQWEPVEGTRNIDTVNKTVSAVINHFSLYSLVGLSLAENSLNNVFVYPNPYKPGSGTSYDRTQGVAFTNLTNNAKIRIFNMAGELVFEGHEENDDGIFEWPATSSNGEKVASGVYIYLITNTENEKKMGKLAVLK